MSISAFDLFKIGIGPSSSHTVGPMLAAHRFINHLAAANLLEQVNRVQILLYGSLSATGKGHGTDHSILLGLMGYHPENVNPEVITPSVERVKANNELNLLGRKLIAFNWEEDMCFLDKSLPFHPNAVSLIAYGDKEAKEYQNTYYSTGGGFLIEADDINSPPPQHAEVLPYSFDNAAELMALCNQHKLRVSELMLENEKVWRTEEQVRSGLLKIWHAMKVCIQNGLDREGILPGGLNVKRRAKSLHQALLTSSQPNVISSTLNAMDWVNLYALAVNEENASGGRMVTAPTNGAAGIIPAVLMYYIRFSEKPNENNVVDFLLAATAIGVLCKKNASISGAEVGCQGEVGSACAMAAAGLCEVLGGTPAQVENAAEIGLEHNLGLTCDPVGGLVQIPCIERNAIAAVKAINAAQMALRGDGQHFISLDKVIKTMRETGMDMQDKYKETSLGGLAVNTPEC